MSASFLSRICRKRCGLLSSIRKASMCADRTAMICHLNIVVVLRWNNIEKRKLSPGSVCNLPY